MSDVPREPLSEDEQASTNYRAEERQWFRKAFVVFGQSIVVLIIAMLLDSIVTSERWSNAVAYGAIFAIGALIYNAFHKP